MPPLAALQSFKGNISIRDPVEFFHPILKRFEHPVNLPVSPLMNDNSDNLIFFSRKEMNLCRIRLSIGQSDTAAQLFGMFSRKGFIKSDLIGFFHFRLWMHHAICEFRVIR